MAGTGCNFRFQLFSEILTCAGINLKWSRLDTKKNEWMPLGWIFHGDNSELEFQQCHSGCMLLMLKRKFWGHINIKMPSYWIRNSGYKDQMVSLPPLLYDRNPYTWKDSLMASSYGIEGLGAKAGIKRRLDCLIIDNSKSLTTSGSLLLFFDAILLTTIDLTRS